jgi:hypothetical protein
MATKKNKEYMPEVEKTMNMYLPYGEWLKPLLSTLAVANMRLEQWEPDFDSPNEYENLEKCYQYRVIPSVDTRVTQRATPKILFQVARSKEVWESIMDPEEDGNSGWTGSDVALEQEVPGFEFPSEMDKPVVITNPRSWEVPLIKESRSDKIPVSTLYLGLTPRLDEMRPEIKKSRLRPQDAFQMKDLVGTNLYTSYPRLTQLFLGQSGLTPEEIAQIKVKTRQGKIEGKWRTDRKNASIVDIGDSFKTGRDNLILPARDILQARLVCVEGPNISPREQQLIDGLREDLERAAKRARNA